MEAARYYSDSLLSERSRNRTVSLREYLCPDSLQSAKGCFRYKMVSLHKITQMFRYWIRKDCCLEGVGSWSSEPLMYQIKTVCCISIGAAIALTTNTFGRLAPEARYERIPATPALPGMSSQRHDKVNIQVRKPPPSYLTLPYLIQLTCV